MKVLYTPSKYYIGPYRCVALDPNDKMISGDNGWIYEANTAGTRLGVVVVGKDGSEKLTYCNLKDLKDLVSSIGVLRDMRLACWYANNPNKRWKKELPPPDDAVVVPEPLCHQPCPNVQIVLKQRRSYRH